MPTALYRDRPAVAYFSMEIALEAAVPTYSGGLGVLAGDTLRSAADLGLPMVGVTLLHRKGYFRQQLDESGRQVESPEIWSPEDLLQPLETVVSIEIQGRAVSIRPWLYEVRGLSGRIVPVYLLDTDLPDNDPADRTLTDLLYGGDPRYRLGQEAVLGLGGVAVLQSLGYDAGLVYHMNEGHAALLTLALLEDEIDARGAGAVRPGDVEAVRRHCVFTTHTPVPAGHDQFPIDLVREVLGPERTAALQATDCTVNGTLNMTFLGLRFSRYVNGVSMRHGEISLGMFPEYPITAITNGVHASTWTSTSFAELFDRWLPGWRYDNIFLRYAIKIPLEQIREAHARAKRDLFHQIDHRSGVRLKEDVLTLGFARRATPYKRADFLLSDIARLRSIARGIGPLQIVYAGKAHPKDQAGKDTIRRVVQAAADLGDAVPIVYLENYDMELARHMVAGVDLWVNTPRRPQEASGTSGMKAALNGVPSLSVLDGWWIEGHIEGVTGWSIPHGRQAPDDETGELNALYDKLERTILPMFYGQRPAFTEVMRSAIALNGSFFNTHRMLSQYVRNAYYPAEAAAAPSHVSTSA